MDLQPATQQRNKLGIPEISPYLNSLATNVDGVIAIHFYLSKLLPYDYQSFQVLELFSLLKQVFAPLKGQAFILKNDDLIYICQNSSSIYLDRCLSQFKRTLSADTLIHGNLRPQTLYTVFPLTQKLEEFRRVINEIEENPLYKNRDLLKVKDQEGNHIPLLVEGINLETLSFIENSIKNANISNFLKRDPIALYEDGCNPDILSYHFYISLDALQGFLKLNEPISNNIWLFRQVGFYLDKQILLKLPEFMAQKNIPGINVNLNLRTLITTYFQSFILEYQATKQLTFDIDIIDFMAHPEVFEYALLTLREKGCRIGLSGLTIKHLDYLNFKKLPIDSFKIIWDTNFTNCPGKLKNIVRSVGREKIVLTKCDTETAIQTGRLADIHYFHGHALEALLRK